VCLGSSIFYGVLGMVITVAKFAVQVVKFCCHSVRVEDRVSKMKVYKLKHLL